MVMHWQRAARQDIVDSRDCRHMAPGLVLLMRKGLAARIKSVGEEPVRDAAIPVVSSTMDMPEGIERNLVDIVASMALATALGDVT
jgi:hypothetical protein